MPSKVSLPGLQAIVGTLAGVVTIAGALLSGSPLAQAFTNGELLVTAQDAISHRPVTDATIEVLTARNELVATLKPDPTGRAARDVKEGAYIVRVSHPRYAADVRHVQVFSRQVVEVRSALRTGSSTSLDRAVKKFFRF